jgi:hypothetical protein
MVGIKIQKQAVKMTIGPNCHVTMVLGTASIALAKCVMVIK